MLLRILILVVATLATTKAAMIDHDTVQPFPQPEPTTDAEKAAVKFKPSLFIDRGCHPYPAVNAAGDTSAGLKGTGKVDGDCEGPELGSQVYSRSMSYGGKWAIMYAWYFPKDVVRLLPGLFFEAGTRHRWLSAVVWIDDPASESPAILAISTAFSSLTGFGIYKPVSNSYLNGSTTKLAYQTDREYHIIAPTTASGDFEDLIQWEQMTEEARGALEVADFGENNHVPITDKYFEGNLQAPRHARYIDAVISQKVNRSGSNAAKAGGWKTIESTKQLFVLPPLVEIVVAGPLCYS